MIGAIAGDIIGSVFELQNTHSMDFPLFSSASRYTDDTVLTVAVADCLLHGGDYITTFKSYVARYPNAGYGPNFLRWAQSGETEPYGSLGNGSAMRVSPVGFFFRELDTVLAEAEKSAAVTHSHPEGIKGAQATAAAIFLARQGESKASIADFITRRFGYDVNRSLDQIRPQYGFDMSCPGSVPEAIIAFLESTSYVDAIRRAISLGGDSDTIACIAGGIAQAFYKGVPVFITDRAYTLLDEPLAAVSRKFEQHLLTREAHF